MLDWHEWTEDAPPPSRERVVFAMLPRGGPRAWITAIGWYDDQEDIVRSAGHIYPDDPPSRVFWARFKLPEVGG